MYLIAEPKSITHLKKGTRGVYRCCRSLKHGGEKFTNVLSQTFQNTSTLSLVVGLKEIKDLTLNSVDWNPLEKELQTLSNNLISYIEYIENTSHVNFKKRVLISKCAAVSKSNTKLLTAASQLRKTDKESYKVLINGEKWRKIMVIMIGLFGE
ncbi:MAG TPA: hypothetical protein PLN13_03465 [Bacteroidia bacterium]|nr:hypothetical protein [Bacteroidia bacterium]HRH07613.1 hypothetical protein [Bacteroidia bacterium]